MKYVLIIAAAVIALTLIIKATVTTDRAELCTYWQDRLAKASYDISVRPDIQGNQVNYRNARAAVDSYCGPVRSDR